VLNKSDKQEARVHSDTPILGRTVVYVCKPVHLIVPRTVTLSYFHNYKMKVHASNAAG